MTEYIFQITSISFPNSAYSVYVIYADSSDDAITVFNLSVSLPDGYTATLNGVPVTI